MAQNRQPVFTKEANTGVDDGTTLAPTITTAAGGTDFTGLTANTKKVFTAGADGALLFGLLFRSNGTNVATVARIWKTPNTDNTTSNEFVAEVSLPATTANAAAATAEVFWPYGQKSKKPVEILRRPWHRSCWRVDGDPRWGRLLMLDRNIFDPTGKADVQIFEGWATVDLLQWRTWIKPRGKTMCSIFALAGGGGGGGGFTGVAAAARGGGGGGGSSGQASWVGPLYALPNAMAVQVGQGGAGSTGSGVAGGTGNATRLALVPKTAASVPANQLLAMGGATGGGAGTAAAAGAAGAAAAIPSLTTSPLFGMGTLQFLAGQAGAAGGAQTGAVGANAIIPVTGLRVMGGSGGAGVTAADFAGGGVTAITDAYFSETRPIACAAGSNPGSGGFFRLNPFWSWPGMGGGSSNAGVGGVGGPGAFGSGGGGGGGGTTGGRGGGGGPGLVIIICT